MNTSKPSRSFNKKQIKYPMNHLTQISIVLLAGIIISCTQSKVEEVPKANDGTLKYATGFSVKVDGKNKWVNVLYPFQGATKGYYYLLVPKGVEAPTHGDTTIVIQTPINSIVCTSTTYIPLLDYLGETNSLVGFPSTDYISSEKTRSRIDSGFVKDVGIDKGMNVELLTTLQADLVMGYTMTSDLGQFKKIQELGTPVVFNAEYLEKHPLGRAEWIKFMALFFNKEKEADSVFNFIESEYLAAQETAKNVVTRPTVMSGIVYGDAWFLPGGQNYAAKLLKDSGNDYLWRDDPSNGYLQLSFESIYDKAKTADYWIGVGSFKSLAELKASEERYALFKPFKTGQIYTYDARQGAKGGSEFLELGYLRPDLILKDLIKITHPELMPEHELYFHKKLK
jgi:iron complex transport system substrate-binding protein